MGAKTTAAMLGPNRRSCNAGVAYAAGMDASTLTHAQREALQRRTAGYQDYLVRLCARMESIGWSTTGPVYVAAVKPRDSTEALVSALRDAEVRATSSCATTPELSRSRSSFVQTVRHAAVGRRG